jgi:hypothetical protein
MSFRRSVKSGALVAAVTAAWLAFSCGEDEGPSGPSPSIVYPHPDGAEWIYVHESFEYARYVISGVYDHPKAGRTQELHEYARGQTAWEETFVYYLRASADDVRLYVDAGEDRYLVLLKFPLEKGRSWDAGLGLRATFVGMEKVSVNVGTFNCARVTYNGGAGTFTAWWPSGVGGWGAKNYGWWAPGGQPVLLELGWYNLPT